MRAVTIDSDLATLFTFTPRKPPITPIQGVELEGADRELRKSRDATHFATDGPAPRRYDRCTAHTIRCAAVFVRSEKSNALVGDGVPRFRRAPAPLRDARRRSTSSCCTAPESPPLA